MIKPDESELMMARKKREVIQADVESRIFAVRGQKVILDADLAQLYGAETKALNRAVKRNQGRFPDDFVFRLTADECDMRCQIGTASKRNIRYLPYVFTEHGAIMAANVLNSPKAVEMSVFVVRAFVKMREQLLATTTLEKRLAEIEKSPAEYFPALIEKAGRAAFEAQCIPTESSLLDTASYKDFLDHRRKAVAQRLDDFLAAGKSIEGVLT